MGELAYRAVYAMNKVEARMLLVKSYERRGNYSATA